MIELMPGLPDNVVGFTATGEVRSEDYRDVLDPAVRESLTRHEKIQLLYILGTEFTGYSGAALWDDAVVGTEEVCDFDRRAGVVAKT